LNQPLPPGAYQWSALAFDGTSEGANRSGSILVAPPAPAGLSTFGLPAGLSGVTPSALVASGTRLAAWDVARQQYVLDDAIASIIPGLGYWIKTVTPTSLRFAGSTTFSQLTIPLRPGWNLISNPFEFNLNWNAEDIRVRRGIETKSLAEAESAGWVGNYAWGWQADTNNPNNGRYALISDPRVFAGAASELEHWKAYWVLANAECEIVLLPDSGGGGATSVTVTPSGSSALASRVRSGSSLSGRSLRHTVQGDGWLATLAATGGNTTDSVLFGISSRASKGKLQIGKPPAAPGNDGAVEIALVATGRSQKNQRIGVDVKRSLTTHDSWQAIVRTQRANAEVAMTWPDLGRAPRGLRFYLVDETTGARRYMRTTSSYAFHTSATNEERHFRIEVEPATTTRLASELTVHQSGLKDGVRFAVTLAKPAMLTTRVVSPAGKMIATQTVAGRTGLNSLAWNGRTSAGASLPRGVYLLEVTATTDEGEQVKALKSLPLK